MIIKPLSQEVALSTTVGNNISLANIVRVINTKGTEETITIQNNSEGIPVTYATMTMTPHQEVIIEKAPTDTLLGSTFLMAIKIAYAS